VRGIQKHAWHTTPRSVHRKRAPAEHHARFGDWSIYRAGLLTNVLNPNVALFFMAFLPQFVAPTADSRVLAFLFLGAVFIFNGTMWCLFLAWAASAVNSRLRGRPSFGPLIKRAVGAMFVGLGVRRSPARRGHPSLGSG
jgi:threonine/homoserine/homoserine lactone efflux protein